MWNPQPKILYLHGFCSGPHSTMRHFLAAEYGSEAIKAPSLGFSMGDLLALNQHNWVEKIKRFQAMVPRAIEIAQQALDEFCPDVIVGQSFGASIAMQLQPATIPQVLIAPAWRRSTLVNVALQSLYAASPWMARFSLAVGPLSKTLVPFFPYIRPLIQAQARVIHSPFDEQIPLQDSVELVRRSGLHPRTLREVVGKNHRMTDPAALDAIAEMINEQAQIRRAVAA